MRYKAVVFDWAGTVIDFGSFAPVEAFARAFEGFEVDVGVDQARAPMGLPKWDHIRKMLDDPGIAQAWHKAQSSPADDAAADRVYEAFLPVSEDVVADHATLVPGAAAAISELREHGLKIGSTTGYTRSIMERVLPSAAAQGYVPDNLVCSDDLPEGRPGPLGMYKCFIDLVVYPPELVVKVDDTEPGIAEGVAAGCLTIGVTLSGNDAGRTPEEIAAMPELERQALSERIGEKLVAAGADHVIETAADLPDLLRRLS